MPKSQSNETKYEKIRCLRLALSGAGALLLTQVAVAQIWQTVDDFQYAAGKNSFLLGFARDPSGNLFAAGDGVDPAGTYALAIMGSGRVS